MRQDEGQVVQTPLEFDKGFFPTGFCRSRSAIACFKKSGAPSGNFTIDFPEMLYFVDETN